LSASEREHLLRRADDLLAHRFDLLGSEPTELGPVIDWQQDFKAGRSWPLEHISRIRTSYPDHSDIKVPWELSRCQHLPVLAAAYRISGQRRYLGEIGAQLISWIDANPVEFGVNWACTMDVAIRAVNWVAALALCSEDAVALDWFDPVLASLLLHGRFIRGHLEYGDARGNHYLSNVVGLLIIASIFIGSQEGRDWATWATRELSAEMAHEVRADGCCHEASTSYHRLVTELFVVGADAADVLAAGRLDPAVRSGIARMLRFVADYTRPDGLAPQIGDADNGRLLPLADYGAADQRSHLHLFDQAAKPYRRTTRSAAYPRGGFFIMRAGELYAAIRCGDVGIYGRGCHAHNDLLGFELCFGATPVVLDPGAYLYTADPAARNRFRSTAVHSTLQIDHGEQNELREDRLFAMTDRARAELLSWEAGDASVTLIGRHHGFEALPAPATHTRRLRLDGDGARLEIVDRVVSEAAHDLTWAFPLAASEVELLPGGAAAYFAGLTLRIATEGLRAEVLPGWISAGYGERHRAPLLRLRGRSEIGHHETRLVLALTTDPEK
jgi:Heparinase II/III-like protein/Heparinase II/III N-terminus